jgi:2-polyprenyl-6-methoxyphenol hydroxylase-like FAD-dependent oxidoreductase
VFLVGDAAMGSPYFQSISLGFECAMFLAGLLAQRDLPVTDMMERYERLIYKQWLRVYMRTKMPQRTAACSWVSHGAPFPSSSGRTRVACPGLQLAGHNSPH